MIDIRATSVRNSTVASPVITSRTTVATALRLLREHGLNALPVSDGDRLLGLVRETGLLRLTPSDVTTLDVYELRDVLDKMTVARIVEPVPSIAAAASLEDAGMLMRSGGYDVLPVMEGARLVGLLPWTALLP